MLWHIQYMIEGSGSAMKVKRDLYLSCYHVRLEEQIGKVNFVLSLNGCKPTFCCSNVLFEA